MIKVFKFGNGAMAGIKEAPCQNCKVTKACIVFAHLEPALCFHCIATFFTRAIPVPYESEGSKSIVQGFDPEAVAVVSIVHDLVRHPGQRPWAALEPSEREEKMRDADSLLPRLRKYIAP